MTVSTRRLSPAIAQAILLIAALCILVTSAAANAQPVVQRLPDPAGEDLADALQQLSRNPQSLSALVAAGEASLALGDVDAAAGFFARAQSVAPGDARVLAGLALIEVKQQRPARAIELFDRAEAAGAYLAPYAAEIGLAYDLVGQNRRAQQYYAQARGGGDGDEAETIRRLALSQAIAGDAAASEATLLPLLQRGDRAAFRTRAFSLAIAGRAEEAVSIAETMLPARISQRLAPYLRYMPRLTPAQQAAAANFGTFPPAAMIGRDEPAIAALSPGQPAPVPRGGADSRLIPGGPPLGSPDPAVRPEPVAIAQPVGEAAPAMPVLESAPVVQELPPERISLGDAFAEFVAQAEPRPAPQQNGAVDITRIVPPREEPPAPAPPPEPEPSRHFVQVATGKDVAAFRWDWRRIVRAADGLLDGKEAFQAAWGESRRLLAGPFASEAEAQAMVTKLQEKGLASFRFTSARGERIEPLG